MLLPSKKRAAGILQHYNLHYNIALVRVNDYRPSHSHSLKIQHQLLKDCEVVALGCIFKSGELMASRGEKACMLYTYDCKFLMFSTCTITKVSLLSSVLLLVDNHGCIGLCINELITISVRHFQ